MLTIIKLVVLTLFMVLSSKAIGELILEKINKKTDESLGIGFLANLSLFWVLEFFVMLFKLSSFYLNAFGIIYLSDYAWNNVVHMEPRAQLRLERLEMVARPFVSENVRPCPNLQFTLDELNTLANYETNFNDYVRTNLINWLLKGGVSDAQWEDFQNNLTTKVKLDELQSVYQAAFDRYNSAK